MVEFADGAMKAQLGPPDMRLPIQYALSHPDSAGATRPCRTRFQQAEALDFGSPITIVSHASGWPPRPAKRAAPTPQCCAPPTRWPWSISWRAHQVQRHRGTHPRRAGRNQPMAKPSIEDIQQAARLGAGSNPGGHQTGENALLATAIISFILVFSGSSSWRTSWGISSPPSSRASRWRSSAWATRRASSASSTARPSILSTAAHRRLHQDGRRGGPIRPALAWPARAAPRAALVLAPGPSSTPCCPSALYYRLHAAAHRRQRAGDGAGGGGGTPPRPPRASVPGDIILSVNGKNHQHQRPGLYTEINLGNTDYGHHPEAGRQHPHRQECRAGSRPPARAPSACR